MGDKLKYSQVVYLNPELTLKIRNLQERMTELTGSRTALEVWAPHLTIGDGLLLDEKELVAYNERASDIQVSLSPFKIELEGFDFMDDWSGSALPGFSPYVIFLNVRPSENLQRLVEQLKKMTEDFDVWYQQLWPYVPHITIAYKDLDSEGFEAAKKILKAEGFASQDKVKGWALAKQEKGGKWQPSHTFQLE